MAHCSACALIVVAIVAIVVAVALVWCCLVFAPSLASQPTPSRCYRCRHRRRRRRRRIYIRAARRQPAQFVNSPSRDSRRFNQSDQRPASSACVSCPKKSVCVCVCACVYQSQLIPLLQTQLVIKKPIRAEK